jgi:hypothetical protein
LVGNRVFQKRLHSSAQWRGPKQSWKISNFV